MRFQIDDAVALLGRTPSVLRSLLSGLPEAWLLASEGEGTWSPFRVVGHLCDGEETDWIPRARIIVEHGAGRAFDPYDRFRHLTVNHGDSVEARLDRFAALRAESLRALAALGLDDASLDRPGLHPELGPVTMRQLLAAWVAHDLDHLFQISRVLAKQYRDEAGPWVAYLRVLRS